MSKRQTTCALVAAGAFTASFLGAVLGTWAGKAGFDGLSVWFGAIAIIGLIGSVGLSIAAIAPDNAFD